MFNNKHEISTRISKLYTKTDICPEDQQKIHGVKTQIIKLLEHTIKFLKQGDQFNLWEKDYIDQAIGHLEKNTGNTKCWLYACLSCVDRSLVARAEIAESYPYNEQKKDEINNLKPTDYIIRLNNLKQQISSNGK